MFWRGGRRTWGRLPPDKIYEPVEIAMLPLHRTCRNAKNVTGFTLLEMLAVTAVISLLAALAWPTFAKGIQSSHQSVCASNLRQIYQAINLYGTDHNGNLPPAENAIANYAFMYLKDYVAPADLTAWGGNRSGKGIYCCPALRQRVGKEKAGGSNNYGLNRTIWFELNPVWPGSTKAEVFRLGITRPAKTILAGDCCWMASGGHPFATIHSYLTPGKIEGQPLSPHPLHTNGAANVLFADGHVEYWKDTSVLADAKYSDKGADDLWNPIK